MNLLKVFLLLASCVVLGGCASSYVAPSSASSARLRIAVPQSETFASVGVRAYPSGRCESPMTLGMIGGIGKLHHEQSIGIPGSSEFASGTSIERLIHSGSPYMVSMRGLYSAKVCTITFRFTPVRGQDYEAIYSWGGGDCYVTLRQVSGSPTGKITRRKVSGSEQTDKCGKGFS